MRSDPGTPPPSLPRLLAAVVFAIIAIPFLFRLPLMETRGFNPDELMHIHFSWCVAKGLVPYLDYYDHHTPGLHYFLSLFYGFYDVERVADDAIAFILLGRRWMWLATGAILGATFVLGKTWRNARTGLFATLFLANTGFFLVKSLEVRPGVPAAAMMVAAVLLAVQGFRRAQGGEAGVRWRLFSSGFLLGVATMFTQKILVIGPGFALVTVWFLLDSRLAPSRKIRLQLALLQALGYVVPLGLTAAYFAARDGLGPFVYSNVFLMSVYSGAGAWPFVAELVRQDPLYVGLGVLGFLGLVPTAFRRDSVARAEPVVALCTLSVVATLPLQPAMSYQHFLLILPLTSLYASAAFLEVVDRLCHLLAGRFSPARLRDGALVALALLLSVVPLARFRANFDRGNWSTLEGIRYVLRNTAPWEPALDGFTGLGLFRPGVFYHHYHHPDAFEIQSERERQDMANALISGEVVPKLVFYSHYLTEGILPEMNAFVEANYVPSGIEPILVRPFDNRQGWWSDEAPRHLGWDPEQTRETPHVIFDDGWRVPTTEYGAPVRRTRTRKSGLIVPIRRPRDFVAVFRAHADPDAVPFVVELVVNGQSVGSHEAAPRWQDYGFPITVNKLRPGFNQFELRFSAENDSEDRRLELSVTTLELVPTTIER